MKTIILVILSVFMVGCVSNVVNLATNQRDKTYNDVMQSKVAMSEFNLISSWGAPDKSYTFANGSKMISYESSWDVGMGSAYCIQKFIIENEKVTKWGIEGDCLNKSTRTGDKLPSNTPIPRPTLN
ncbi:MULTISPECIES: hypothetical protein [unclassified Acinetobacter]|uniref:hypothetical protein n=1 Tax=unclassified Acinetobacter TaxID=196816 RepID=UPI002577FB5F|nr:MULTISPECIES: hypothetical protein [unclassified Acinetobacter]